MKTAPTAITPANLDCVVMPNGEVICDGKTLGWVSTLGKYLQPSAPTGAATPPQPTAPDSVAERGGAVDLHPELRMPASPTPTEGALDQWLIEQRNRERLDAKCFPEEHQKVSRAIHVGRASMCSDVLAELSRLRAAHGGQK